MKPRPLSCFSRDKLTVMAYATAEDAGSAAAEFVERQLRSSIAERGRANLILATGASQFTFLDVLARKPIDWKKVTFFHLDEYTELSADDPSSFRRYLRERILDVVRPGQVHLIEGDADDLRAEIGNYESLLRRHPIDVACIGIGENGHIGFNDPHVADFSEPSWVKEVELDERCRMQQVNEGWFRSLEDTPRRAITLTIPAIMSSRVVSCVVPGERKVEAVRKTLSGSVTSDCPATVLRRHDNATLFLDRASAAGVRLSDEHHGGFRA